VRHVGHLPRIIAWCTVNEIENAAFSNSTVLVSNVCCIVILYCELTVVNRNVTAGSVWLSIFRRNTAREIIFFLHETGRSCDGSKLLTGVSDFRDGEFRRNSRPLCLISVFLCRMNLNVFFFYSCFVALVL